MVQTEAGAANAVTNGLFRTSGFDSTKSLIDAWANPSSPTDAEITAFSASFFYVVCQQFFGFSIPASQTFTTSGK